MTFTGSIALVIPTLGERPDFLAEAIDSVQQIRTQIPVTAYLLGPKGAKLKLPKGWKFIEDTGTGLTSELNITLTKLSEKYTYITWLGDDDILVPTGFISLYQQMLGSGNVSAGFGHCIYIDELGNKLGINNFGKWAYRLRLIGPNLIPQPGSLLASKYFRKIGGLDTSYSYAFDFKMFLQLAQVGEFVVASEPVAKFRWHEGSLSVGTRDKSAEESRLAKIEVRGFQIVLLDRFVKNLTLWAGHQVSTREAHRRNHEK